MTAPGSDKPLELWGGVECTVNRVGDVYFDQLEKNGHARRLSDLDLFAGLGLKTLRYPVLWERTVDWAWADERLNRLRELGIRPIVGLVHHGSGPRETSLLDPEFPHKLARFARSVAERYPWVELYTPVNEPLTTARFSCLYGHWYPHARDAQSFARALLIQCRAIALCMREIRKVNPGAKLVQTEDLGTIFSTSKLRYQANFENERRWLTWDILLGRFDSNHPLWFYFRRNGISRQELRELADDPCPPDLLGINHYVTSDRFLDDRLSLYPEALHGGNGRHRYVDIEAVRVVPEGQTGPSHAIRQCWERYRLPIAITEAHLGCTREEQLRWLREVWEAARSLRAGGADVRAVTAWSLLGSYNWNSLVTRDDDVYEAGVFDVRCGTPRPTALAEVVRSLAEKGEYHGPLMETPGWWQRPIRLTFGPTRACATWLPRPQSSRPLLITGARGTLGRAFARLCEQRGIAYRLLLRNEMNIAEPESVARVLDELKPWAVVNAAGYVRVDDAEHEMQACYRDNVLGPVALAAECEKRGIRLVTFSSDLVFGGTRNAPYTESSEVSPLNYYGKCKAEAESKVLAAFPNALVIRTSAFFGPWDEYNFVTVSLRRFAGGERVVAAEDAIVSPTYVPDLVNGTLDLLIDGENGVWHLANRGQVSWATLARLVARNGGYPETHVEGRPMAELSLPAPRPLYSALGTEKGMELPDFELALDRYFRERAV